ncbi:MAG: 2-succinyl-5-enolpyruvyl-6-hydroxy-3-cyclohexene-1-carboxylic-acid synthase [Micrococcales bacterium]|nr:2-succinyl-5-enolpyruvyl-6-hydroxy-3-cyclohexene-1-carboxylic-acid synthase [Micrococcales bacterium]
MISPSQQFAATLIAELVSKGVRNFYISPGARSQALAIAVGQLAGAGKLSLTVRLDERSLAFTALGRAIATGEPSVVITTSGTAVANLHPAVLEAHHSSVPLILLTADRPSELRGVGANQTTNQVGIFANCLRSFVDVPAARPSSIPDAGSLAANAIANSMGTSSQAGPVQLNLQFVEPLSSSEPTASSVLSALESSPLASGAEHEELLEIEVDDHTVVIAGADAGADAVRFAEKAKLPLFAEPSSGSRFGSSAIVNYQAGLLGPLAQQVRRVVVFGKPTLSRPIIALIKNSSVYVAKSRKHGKFDVGHNTIASAWQLEPKGLASSSWLESWKEAAASSDARSEFVAAVWDGAGSVPLLIGASNLIRVADSCVKPATVRAYSNRGLSGIDGTVATAIGIAQAGAGVRALIGDLTLLHDIGSLNLSGLRNLNVQLIVGNDSGGQIFRKLEVAKTIQADLFKQLFLTPQTVNIEAAASAFGWQYVKPESVAELSEAMKLDGFVIIDYQLDSENA